MEVLFLSYADQVEFIRTDMESGHWTQEEMNVSCTYPYDPDRLIERGMRMAFRDPDTNAWQVFEVRQATTIEPDHYQQITAEHIVISELSDDHQEATQITNKTCRAALNGILGDTLWTVGTYAYNPTSSGDVSRGSVWQAVQAIATNWNAVITPRVTIDDTGITHRYLDITDPAGTFRGVRLSINKNLTDVSVTYDDTDVYTAMYGFGGAVGDDNEELTFADEVWTATSDHPAKPAGQTYIEDPTAQSIYSRNGRPRWGYYQNGDIKDAAVLLQKTWETLQQNSKPKISISGTVTDLYRLGYTDQPLRLNDIAIIDVEPTGEHFDKRIIRCDVDLLNPASTTVEIGDYIPNIIYINRDISEAAKGGGGGGGKGDDNKEHQLLEYEAAITNNGRQIQLRAFQRDLDDTDGRLLKAYAAIGLSSSQIDTIVTASGVMLDEDGQIIVDENGNPVFYNDANPMYSRIIQNANSITTVVTKTGINSLGQNETLYSQIQQNAQAITLKVSAGDVATELAVECGNVSISGGNLVVDGYITSAGLVTEMAAFTGNITCLGNIVSTGTLSGINLTCEDVFLLQGESISVKELSFLGSTYNYAGQSNVDLAHYHAISASESNGVITITQGAAQTTPGTATFNIAATQFYQDAIVAATASGAASVTLSAGGWTGPSGTNTVTASNGATVSISLPSFSTSGGTSWTSAHKTTVYFTTASVTGALASKEVDAFSVYSDGYADGYADAGGGSGTYSAGWQAARAMVVPPSQIGPGESRSFTVGVPGATEDTQQTLTYTLTQGTPGPSGYVAVSDNNGAVARIDVSGWYAAGEASVTLSAGGWTGPSGTNTVTASNGATLAVSLPSFSTSGGTTFDSNHKTTVYFTTASVTGYVASKEVDASSVYTAGAAEVTLGTPTWGGNTSDNNTFTVTASNSASVSQSLYMTGGSSFNSSHTTTVYVRRGGTSGTICCRKTIDATDVYTSGQTAGAAAVTLGNPSWGGSSSDNNTFTVTASNSASVSQSLYLTGGSSFNSSHTTTVYVRSGGTGGTIRLRKTIDATTVYNSGWAAAVAKVSIPGAGSDTSATLTVPSSTVGESTNYSIRVSLSSSTPSSSGYANCYIGSTTRIARISIGSWYTTGYNTGVAAGESHFTAVSNAKGGLTYLGSRELGYMDHGNFESVGTHHWFYASSSGTETLYRKNT